MGNVFIKVTQHRFFGRKKKTIIQQKVLVCFKINFFKLVKNENNNHLEHNWSLCGESWETPDHADNQISHENQTILRGGEECLILRKNNMKVQFYPHEKITVEIISKHYRFWTILLKCITVFIVVFTTLC